MMELTQVGLSIHITVCKFICCLTVENISFNYYIRNLKNVQVFYDSVYEAMKAV